MRVGVEFGLNIPYEVDITTLPTKSLADYARKVSGEWLYFRYKPGERGGIIQDARRENEVDVMDALKEDGMDRGADEDETEDDASEPAESEGDEEGDEEVDEYNQDESDDHQADDG